MHHVIKKGLENIVAAIKTEAAPLEGKSLLVSGGAGFLGSYLLGTVHILNKNVFKNPCRVISVDNYITGSEHALLEEIADKNLRMIEQDITKPLNIDEPVDYIIHAAGLASPYYYKKFPLETIDAAVGGAKNLLEFAVKNPVESFLLFSSSEVYGDPEPNSIPTPERYRGNVACIGPRACYDESKRLAETLAMTYHEVHGIPVKIVRPFNVYGPGMKKNDYRVIPTFITQALSGQPLSVHDTGNQTRTFCYVSDAVTGFWKVLLSSANGEVYNVGVDRPEVNMVTLANFIAELSPNNVSVKLVPYPESYPTDEPKRRCPDISKIRNALGYDPKVGLKTGLARTIEWFRDTYTC